MWSNRSAWLATARAPRVYVPDGKERSRRGQKKNATEGDGGEMEGMSLRLTAGSRDRSIQEQAAHARGRRLLHT
jgi:hypothetical protein